MAKTTDDDIVEAIESVDTPVARAKDVAEQVSIGQRAVLNRLDSLVGDDRVERLDVGAKSAVFWNAPGESSDSSRSRSRSGVEADGEDDSPPSEPEGEGVETDVERVFDSVDGSIDLPGSGTKLEERRVALRAAVWYLVENDTASRSDFEEDVYPDHPARYETAYSWWKNAIMGGLGDVADATDAIERADYSGQWRFVGWSQ